MSDTNTSRRKWLVAAWPGMGHVGSIAAGYLVHKLEAKPVLEMSGRGFFDIEQVEIKSGVVVPPRMPQSLLHQWSGGEDGPELLIFLGEAQPNRNGHDFAHLLLDEAAKLGAERVMTFASVASQLHPSKAPKVFGVVTQPDMKADVERIGAGLLQDGQIGGLNGVLLGAAAERGLPGVCLLGEIPYFAGAVANPKAARAIVDAFVKLTGIGVDTQELAKHEGTVDRVLLSLLERLKQQAEQGGNADSVPLPEEPIDSEDVDQGDEGGQVAESDQATEGDGEPESREVSLDFSARERIEKLFAEARRDRTRAVLLKGELDKLGVFGQYEDRFLDLFKRAA